jgi:LysR family cyn operon transcriptional activator
MMAEISHLSRKEKGILRIGYSFGVMSGLTMDLTQSFQSEHTEYELDYAEMPDKMVEDLVFSGEIDIGFAAYVDKDKFDYEHIIDSEILFVPHKGSCFYDRESVSVAELEEEPLTLRNANFATTRIMSEEFEKHGIKPEIVMNTGGILRSIKLCKDGIANTVIIDSVATQLDKSNLRIIPFEEEIKWPLYMITKKDIKRSMAIDVFKSFMAKKRIVSE